MKFTRGAGEKERQRGEYGDAFSEIEQKGNPGNFMTKTCLEKKLGQIIGSGAGERGIKRWEVEQKSKGKWGTTRGDERGLTGALKFPSKRRITAMLTKSAAAGECGSKEGGERR